MEGQTEEAFVNELLAPELAANDVFADARRVMTGRRHGRLYRGGLVSYEHLANDLSLWMKQDDRPDSWFTTMVDLYGLPSEFPGRATMPAFQEPVRRVVHLEAALAGDVLNRLDGAPVARRFVPYIQLHEFEALLLSDPAAFLEAFPEDPRLVDKLAAIRAAAAPEDIDEGSSTAPSKRILALAPGYEKVVAGLLIGRRIGLARMRQSCPHFDAWVARLTELGQD